MDDFITAPNGQQVRAGDEITYRTWGGERRTGVVEEVSEDIKNGRPGFAFANVWGYADQIVTAA